MKLAPVGLLRIAALPIAPLLAMAPPAANALVDEALAAREAMELLRVAAEEVLHQLVPRLPDTLRGAAITLKRAIHNGRPAPAAAGMLQAVMPAAAAAWLSEQSRHMQALAAAEAELAREIPGHVRELLWAIASQERFRRALALASPALFAEADRLGARPSERGSATKLERGLMRYLTRAATKCSPFGLFTHQAAVAIDGGGDGVWLAPSARDSHVRVNRTLVFELCRDAAGRLGRLRVNASLRHDGAGGVDLLVPDYVTFSDRLLRLGRPARLRLHPRIADELIALDGDVTLAEVQAAFAAFGLTEDKAGALARQCLAKGLLLAAPCGSGFDDDPTTTARAALCESDPEAASVSQRLGLLSDGACAFAGATSRRRAALLAEARAAAGSGSAAQPFLEEGYFQQPAGSLDSEARDLLDELGAILRRDAVLAAPYVLLRDLFVADYGAGGTCDDLPSFLLRASGQLARRQWWRADPAEIEQPAAHDAAVRLTAMVHFEGLGGTAPRVILNQVYPSCGSLSARHAAGPSEAHTFLRRRLAAWLREVCAGAEPVEIMLSGDCNPLQSHPRLTSRILYWPIEAGVAGEAGAIPAAAVSLHHDRVTGLIEMRAPGGALLAPLYLGTTVPHPAWGAEFWLTTLAMPYRIRTPIEDLVAPAVAQPAWLPLPERVTGRVVLRRRSWWVTTAWLGRRWFARSGALRLFDVAEDCREHGLPRRLFVRAPRAPTRSASDDHKPLWIDIRNPFCLDLLQAMLVRSEWLQMVEAQPDFPDWPMVGDQAHAAELLIEMAGVPATKAS